ncbi:class I SAM-dependent methyltransferase [Streptomyces sp. CA-294286]|uniref:class I SAM-dependent methyltransferase n=1 Tax=Streptomyces sp. CA-294286 TaxID=3240070 RepID=UPI003D8FDCE2
MGRVTNHPGRPATDSRAAPADTPADTPAADRPTDPATAAFRSLFTDEGQALLAELRDHDPAQELALATRLRRDHSPELVSAALSQARLRQRAVAKFGAQDARRMYFTPHGVEQSTRRSVAEYRAARFRALGPARVLDLCGGIGGDALAMARAGLSVEAVDLDPTTCLAARANAEALLPDPAALSVVTADVTTYDLTGAQSLFVDPARRSGARGRIFDPEAYSPPLSFSVDAVRKVGLGAIKIAPGIPHELVPDDFEAEWISDNGDVKEAVLWHAADAPAHGAGPAPAPASASEISPAPVVAGARRATLLPSGVSLVGRGLPDPAVRKVGRYLYEPDGAVIRAHLVAEVAEELDGGLIDETIAYITADELRPTPYATPYEITDELPFGVKKLKALLREREVGVLTVKKRGSAVEPEELRKKMKLSGRNSATVFLTRVAGAPAMLVGRPAHP